MSISFFPTPYPDETFYSLLARYRSWSRISNLQAKIDLFGKRKRKLGLVLPGDLENLYSRLPADSTLSPQILIDNHTILPIFYPFIASSDRTKLQDVMVHKDSTCVSQHFAGMSNYISDYQRVCPICLEKDEECYGEPYLHRIHQLRGVVYCPDHKVSLLNTNIKNDHKSAYQCIAISKNVELVKSQFEIPKEYENTLCKVALTYNWLLNNQPEFVESKELIRRYRCLLQKCGLISVGGNLKFNNLTKEFKKKFPVSYLKECHYYDICNNSWFYIIIYPDNNIVNPLRHVLLMVFLDVIPQELFSSDFPNVQVFGFGPWLTTKKMDWGKRDKLLSDEIKKVAEEVKSQPGWPIRITKALLERRIGICLYDSNFISKLQLTQKTLDTVIEPIDIFRFRKIAYGVNLLKLDKKSSFSELLRKCRIGTDNPSPIVKMALMEALNAIKEVAISNEKETFNAPTN
ncbi:TnsD family Tn7-like transposition protein [Sporomusa sphaeroides]|uniref:TnsD family Tn7-like transposition protein n=1 Tax=Sporomusa sphaeroides TaxID=47679 RepID=UPI002BE138B0|nr:TnsD family Tn7-like transposition protein [Sporomusa sphaeroides]HML31962.1 TnsD family Tn7-like transposition protein [Sporomusa sphaeroides]